MEHVGGIPILKGGKNKLEIKPGTSFYFLAKRDKKYFKRDIDKCETNCEQR